MKKKEKKKCLYCGNAPTNHFMSYTSQSIGVPLTPVIRLASLLENRVSYALVKALITPYLWMFRQIRMLGINKDSSKASTERSKVIWEEAERRGIEMEQFVIMGKPIEQYRAKVDGKWWRYFESLPIPAKLHARSYAWMDDKALLKKLFMKNNIPVAKGKSVSSVKDAFELFDTLEKPIITKPQLGSRGRHTTTHIYTKEELRHGFKIAQELCRYVIVEEHLNGSVYRGTYVGGEIVGILRGDPPRITGDGKRTIRDLIESKNQTKHPKVKDVEITKKLEQFLERQAYTLESVLPNGKIMDLSEKIGTSYGGYAAEMIRITHPKILAELKRAGDLLKAPVIGFDFIIEDPRKDPDNQKWGIIEANSLPFINLHHFPLEGEPINVAAKIWDLWK